MTNHPLALYRKRVGLTQAKVAQQAGVGRWTINSIETGRRLPSLSLVARLIYASDGALQADDFVPRTIVNDGSAVVKKPTG